MDSGWFCFFFFLILEGLITVKYVFNVLYRYIVRKFSLNLTKIGVCIGIFLNSVL